MIHLLYGKKATSFWYFSLLSDKQHFNLLIMKTNSLHFSLNRFAAGLLLSLCLISCKEERATSDIRQKIRDVNTIELAEVTFSKVYTIKDMSDDSQEQKGSKTLNETIEQLTKLAAEKLKIGERVGVYGLRKTYSAYIDLSKLEDEDIVISDKQVAVNLPKIEIRMLGNDFKPETYFEQATLLRSKITEEERVSMRQKASDRLIKELSDSKEKSFEKLNKEAEQKATAWFTATLKSWGFQNVSINFKK